MLVAVFCFFLVGLLRVLRFGNGCVFFSWTNVVVFVLIFVRFSINYRTYHLLWFVTRVCIDPSSCVFDVETNQLSRFQTSLFHSILFLDLTMIGNIGMIAINLTINGVVHGILHSPTFHLNNPRFFLFPSSDGRPGEIVGSDADSNSGQNCGGSIAMCVGRAKHIIRVFPKIGVPQNGWFIMENPIL